MKRKILMLLFAGACTLASAQSSRQISGYVIDKKTGNPLPGATVEAKGGAETTTTDMDGSFTIEVSRFLKKLQATYAGMDPKAIKLNESNEVIFQLSAKKHRWFLNLNVNIGTLDQTTLGGSWFFGQLGNWGWFARVGSEFTTGTDYKADIPSFPLITGGAIKRIKGEHFAFLGGGLGGVTHHEETYLGPVLEVGYMFRHNHLSLNAGPSLRYGIDCEKAQLGIQVGAGYAF